MADPKNQLAATPKRVNRLAIASALVLLAGYGCIVFILSGGDLWFQQLAVGICIFAALLALAATIRIAWRPQPGLWLSIPVLLLAFVGMLFGEAEIGMTRTAADEATAVRSLRALDHALVAYARAHKSDGYPASLSSLACKEESWCVESSLANGSKQRFRYSYVPGVPHSDGVRDRYQILGAPIDDADYRRHFFIDDSGTIRYGKADQSSAILP